MNIGDVFFRALLDDSQLQVDSQRAGNKAGQTLGQQMASKAGSALKAGGALFAGAATALAVAGAFGLAELDAATRKYAADTGATVEETRSAQAAINDLFRRNTQSYEEIGGVLGTLRTQLHLTEAQTEASAQGFLTFAKAIGGPPVETTRLMTDVLKAYNLTVEQAPALMDELVAAHQRYGGSITDNLATLAALAPAMTAANLTYKDGIGLLDLFAKAGVDAAAAPAALTKALHKVKSPDELKQLIAQIAQEPDDFKRAGLAADLFGVKAGTRLAAALKGTTGQLDDYTVSAQDAAGATQKAADVIDQGFGERFTQILHNAQGAVTGFFGFLASIDPTGFLTAALIPKLGTGIARAFELAAGLAVVERAIGFAGGKGATLYLKALYTGDAIGAALRAAWTRVASTALVGGVIEQAGGLAATAYIKALIAGDVIGGAVTAAWVALTGESAAAAGISGGVAGTAFAAGAAVALLAAPVLIVKVAIDWINTTDLPKPPGFDLLGKDPNQLLIDQINKGKASLAAAAAASGAAGGSAAGQSFSERFVTSARESLAPLPALGADTGRVYSNEFVGSARHGLAPLPALGEQAGKAYSNKLVGGLRKAVIPAATIFSDLTSHSVNMRDAMVRHAAAIASAVRTMTGILLGQATALISGYYDPLIAQDDLRVQRDTIATNQIAINAARVALAKTKAGSDERKQAQLTLDQAILTQRQSLAAYNQTKLNLLASGQLSKKDQQAWLADLQKKYKTATGDAKIKIQSLIDKIHALQNVNKTGVTITVTEGRSKQQGTRATGGPVVAGLPYLVNENTPRSEIWVPDVSGVVRSGAVPAMAATPVSVVNNYYNTANVEGLVKTTSPLDIARELGRLARAGQFTPKLAPGS